MVLFTLGWAELHPYLRNAPAAPQNSTGLLGRPISGFGMGPVTLSHSACRHRANAANVCALSVLLMLRQETGFKWLILVCIGAFTKITFLLSLAPICIIIGHSETSIGIAMDGDWACSLALLPIASLPTEIPSHDGLSLQLERMLRALQGDNTGSREQWHNLTLWLSNPLKALG